MTATAALMLRHLGLAREAGRIDAAVDAVLCDGATRPPDLGGATTTDEGAHAVCEKRKE